MLALTSPYLWYVARASGEVALVLLASTLVLGSLVATRVGGDAVGRFELNELHRSIALLAVLFVGLHVTVTVIDSYVPIGLFSALVPFTSSYRRVYVALGTIAIDLMLTVWLTSVFKERLRNSTWRVVHWLSWSCFAIAAVHGFLIGTDERTDWALALTATCVAAVALSALWRVTQRPDRASGRTAHSPLRRPADAARPLRPTSTAQSTSSRPTPPPARPRRS